jgi:hypothetical protein
MKERINVLALLALVVVLAACTRVTEFGPIPEYRALVPAVPPGQAMITRLIIDYTPTATKQTGDDPRFNADVLRRMVDAGLAAQGLLDLKNAAVVQVLAVEVDEFDVHATSNIVLMGRVTSSGVLGASVRIRDGSSKELRQFHVRAEIPLKVGRNSTERDSLQSLYQAFIGQIADAITGRVRPQPAQAR